MNSKPNLLKDRYYQLTNDASTYGIIAYGENLKVVEDEIVEYQEEKYNSWNEVYLIDEETYGDQEGYVYQVWHRWDGVMEIVKTIIMND